ncbi:hypothetical protein [Vibrio hyugaensis]|uniref:hypothetical protein n=1 Tax=Vibrio hyugaensis TaxID=1534743 RepID=UPI0005EE1804|nr:hypothetical protein [Vibrio hyugaensis]
MAFSKREAIQIIDKLVELTQHGRIEWVEEQPPAYLIASDSKVDLVYVTTYLNRHIRTYKRDFKYWIDDVQFTWDKEVVIEFVDENGRRMGRFPHTPNTPELLRAIQYQNPQLQTFFNDMFG